MEIVIRPHRENLVRWARNKPSVVVLSADLTSSSEADLFRDTFPERFFSMGMAEQNMMGFAAGLAREGFYPFVHTFAVFVSRRPYDQVAMSIGYPNLPVRLIGFLPGVTTPGGVTHQAIDDVGLMRLIPNMTILDCGDATDAETVLDAAQAVEGPVYIRMLRGEVPRLFDPSLPLLKGRSRVLSQGSDVAVLSSSICTEEAIRATSALAKKGVSVQHLHLSTLKPFSDPATIEAATGVRFGIITMENHSIIGGLGSAVAESMAEAGVGQKLIRLGLQDCYAHGASRKYLMQECGLDAMSLVSAVEDLLGSSLDLSEEDLVPARVEAFSGKARAEAPEAL